MLIKNGRILDPANGTDTISDILIKGERIALIGRGLEADDSEEEVIDAGSFIVAPGLVDVHAHYRDPGQTEKEDLHTGALAAAAGGYTSVLCMANTVPAVDSIPVLEDILKRASEEKIHIYQSGAVTMGREGRKLVPMEELLGAGAVGFTDDGTPITDKELVGSAMTEAKRLGVPLSFHEEDPRYVTEAGINAGKTAAAMGLTGADRMAEKVMIERDLTMAIETGAVVDIQHVSSREGVELIRRFRKKDPRGLIHAEACPHHFSLTEEWVVRKGTLAKVNPPLRTEEDRLAIIEGIKDGTIDLIATDHAPHTMDEKSREFVKAPSGMIGQQTALALGITNLVEKGHIPMSRLIELMSLNPARLYGFEAGSLAVGNKADIVIFDPKRKWEFKESDILSRSHNSPFIGMTFTGRVIYTIADGKVVYRL